MEKENTIMLPETLNVPTKHCVLMFNILNVVAKRGAINPDEFKVVGELVDFLKQELKVEEQTKQLPPVVE
tara:strand:- start:283 stop:492 length:210 start_codon:yes stop_codon:yes gene_type:complete